MSEAEISCLQRHLQATNTLVEFGSGGSTLLAVKTKVKNIFSVESDLGWVEKLKKEPLIQNALKNKQLRFISPDLGLVGAWGRPCDITKKADWYLYHSAVWQKVDKEVVPVCETAG